MENATSKPHILIEFGRQEFLIPTIDFYNGVSLAEKRDSSNKPCSNVQIVLGIKDNRLYVSTEFKSLESKNTIGSITFNHWKVYKEQALEYPQQNDTMLEVRDKQSKIVFAIKYGQVDLNANDIREKGVLIRGYFIGDTCITIANNSIRAETNCISMSETNWEQKAMILISQIKTIFPN